VIATVLATGLVLVLALAVPLVGLADLAARGTLAVFVLINLALIKIHRAGVAPGPGVFVAPRWVPYAGLTASLVLIVLDLMA